MSKSNESSACDQNPSNIGKLEQDKQNTFDCCKENECPLSVEVID